jgi:hypothetical protein
MKSIRASMKQTIAGAAVIAAFAIAAPSLSSAQEATTDSKTTTTFSSTASATDIQAYEAEKSDTASSSELELCEAVQRTDARFKKFVEQGIPEEFGSEEPFTFDPSLC